MAATTGGGGMTPKELSEYDDLATALILDSYLGFTTHKMNLRFRPPKVKKDVVKKIMVEFKANGDYDRAYGQIVDLDWYPASFANKGKRQQTLFKEHVSSVIF
jgi:histone-lysine N-methyltransferase SUV420H